jgi:predicted nuclease of restriction endonuclease-like (RecB) superfamily
MVNKVAKSEEYKSWLQELKQKFRQTQLKAAVKVNTVLLEFYWDLGADIVERQKNATWGSGFLKQLSQDLMVEFPDVKGFSAVNLQHVRRWYLFYSKDITNFITGCYEIEKKLKIKKTSQNISQLCLIPWGHNIVIISKCKTVEKALFYVNKTIEHGWSRVILTHQIESGLFERAGKAVTNFTETLPKAQSDLANEMIKDPYKFDFFSLGKAYNERDLESALLDHIISFLLELGSGFAFVGRQKTLQVGKREFFIDLLFYHTQMHCYVVIELKVIDFEPEFAGKLNFYLKAVDMQIKTEKDEPTIGILICKSKDKTVVEYALSDIYKPMAVSEYNLTHILPENLKSSLPTSEDIEAEFNRIKE